jgi:hypothetical protein
LIASLEAGGFIQRIARFVPRQAANAYRLLTPWIRRVHAQLDTRLAARPDSSTSAVSGDSPTVGVEAPSEGSAAHRPSPEIGEAPAAVSGLAATAPRRRVFTLADGSLACLHSTPPCEDCARDT